MRIIILAALFFGACNVSGGGEQPLEMVQRIDAERIARLTPYARRVSCLDAKYAEAYDKSKSAAFVERKLAEAYRDCWALHPVKSD